MKSLQSLYDEMIAQMIENKRPMLSIPEEVASELIIALESESLNKIKMSLGVMANAKRYNKEFEAPLIKLLKQLTDSNLIIFTLDACSYHIIARRSSLSERMPAEFLESLSHVLNTQKEYESLEWVVRIIEQLGMQGIYFQQDLLKVRPKMTFLSSEHKKNLKQIIDMLLERWHNAL